MNGKIKPIRLNIEIKNCFFLLVIYIVMTADNLKE